MNPCQLCLSKGWKNSFRFNKLVENYMKIITDGMENEFNIKTRIGDRKVRKTHWEIEQIVILYK